ncbi:uncharacterized protein LOC143331923 [Chaetodon auriga]|uniref:uncharacterized protein LOC143331923 n=1 Tax=Chaetodon auriga TaxID=39042 RepID=UPI004032ADC2
MGNSTTADITIGNIKGTITKLSRTNPTSINVAITPSGDVNILKENTDLVTGFSRLVHIPKEASDMAIQRNGSFAAVLLFPGMRQDDPNSSFLNDEIVGIEMGTEIFNLSNTIDIHFKNVDKSPPPQNMTSTDFTSLSYITSIGCGVSMFFLALAFFKHCLIRQRKASQAAVILINLFTAMFSLNLSFLINESIAKLGNYGACLAIVLLKPTAENGEGTSSIKTNSIAIFGLFLLLGITWAFAFFSYGPMRIPSYYIFTILNSFQGFFLFIYYYNSSKTAGVGRSVSSSSTATSKTAIISPYQ